MSIKYYSKLCYTLVMNKEIQAYHDKQMDSDKAVCERLYQIINENLHNAESKVWHAHPVWFLDGNPIVGYSKLKDSVRLLFWSGQGFDEPGLTPEGTFKAADIRYTDVNQIEADMLKRCLKKAEVIQWDYKNIVKNRGLLEKLK